MNSNALISALQNPALYDHPVTEFGLIETHVSWVILTGHYAYKIKKPVNFEFLDYSSLAKRHHYCQEELRLNRQWAPEIYCSVVPIYGTAPQPNLRGEGEIIEYAVKMREFPQSALFSRLLVSQGLSLSLIDELAQRIATFHKGAKQALAENALGSPEHVHAPVIQNFDQIRPLLSELDDLQQLARLRRWAEQQYQGLQAVFVQRKAQGFIRECHGDIYLNNIILWEGRPVIFDCIEFNDDFRWTDVMADIGFLAMDLEDNQQPELAHQLINTYLKQSGDYFGLMVLPYYQAYRAVVRAKVALFQLFSPGLTEQQTVAIKDTYRSYMALAERYTQPNPKALMLSHGFSGSGKSTLAQKVMHHFGAIHISSDIERKRNAGLAFTADSDSGVNQKLYSPENTQQTYQHLARLAEWILQAGYPVIIDATCLKRYQRDLFISLAARHNLPFAILSCQAPSAFLQQTIIQRAALQQDASEADLAILQMQQDTYETLTQAEQRYTLTIHTDQVIDIEGLMQDINDILYRVRLAEHEYIG